MSGIAIVISGADFSAKNLGKVTFLQDVDVTGIVINGSDSVTGLSSIYTVGYTPVTTSQKGVNWSVTSGSEYASIDSTGLLTIKEGANANSVTIEAVSTFNNTVIATKTVAVTYNNSVNELTSISISEDTSFSELNKRKVSVVYNPANSAYKGVTWSITSGNSYATIDQNGIVTVLNTASTQQSITVKATSTHDASITATLVLPVLYVAEPSWDLSQVYGIMDSNELVAAMRDNDTSFLLEFADDSAAHVMSDPNCVLFALGELQSDPLTYKRSTLHMYGSYHTILLGTGLLKNIPWTAGNTSPIYGTPDGGWCEFINGTDGRVTAGKSMFICNKGNSASFSGKALTLKAINNGCGAHHYLSFGFKNEAAISFTDFPTYYAAITAPNPTNKAYKIKTFIIASGNYATAEEVKANRSTAYVDIKFDGSGMPYNAGSKGTLTTILKSNL